MPEFILSFFAVIRVFFRSRADTALEVLALRQQVAALKRQRPRPTLNPLDRFFWTTLCRFWSRWADVLVVVKPKTVISWHRAGFRLYWRWRSRPRGGRPKITEEIRALIRRLVTENPGWGAPKIHGELQKLGLVVAERTVARYLWRVQRRGDPGKRWLAFLQNHREVMVAFDYFTVPTVTFWLLYCFLVIARGRCKILHFNVTRHPTADWVVQQLREAFPKASPYRCVILDRDSRFDADVIAFLKATGLEPKRTSVRAPWQNGISERWVGSCRRVILDHVIALNEQHLRRLIRDYVDYHHDDRIHDSLEKDTPNRRPVEPKPTANSILISMPRLGGLHHRYSCHHWVAHLRGRLNTARFRKMQPGSNKAVNPILGLSQAGEKMAGEWRMEAHWGAVENSPRAGEENMITVKLLFLLALSGGKHAGARRRMP